MEEIITLSKEKEKLRPYRKIQLLIILFISSFIFSLFIIYSHNSELNLLIKQNENLLSQASNYQYIFNLHELIYLKLQINYESLYQLDSNYTTDIIHNLNEYFQVMEWANEVQSMENSFYLCYKATTNGDTAEAFHSNCGGSSPLLFLFETVDGYRFGAYITNTIIQRGDSVYDPSAFLFSFDTKKKYQVTIPELAYRDNVKGFPLFGKKDLFISEGFLTNSNSICEFPQAYERDEEFFGDYPLTGGLKNFKLKEMEVLIIFSKYIDNGLM